MECENLKSTRTHGNIRECSLLNPNQIAIGVKQVKSALCPLSRSPSFLAHTQRGNTQLESRLARSLARQPRQWRCRVQPCLPPLPPLLSSPTASRSLVWFSRPTGASLRQRRRGPHEVWSIRDAFHVSMEPDLPMVWLSLIRQEQNDCNPW